MNPEARWVARESIARLAALQKNTSLGISQTVRCGIDAYRLFDALDAYERTDRQPLVLLMEKLQTDKWFGAEPLTALASKQVSLGVHDAFTAICVAAYKQFNDAKYLLSGGVDAAILGKIAHRHAAYRTAQAAGVVLEERP